MELNTVIIDLQEEFYQDFIISQQLVFIIDSCSEYCIQQMNLFQSWIKSFF